MASHPIRHLYINRGENRSELSWLGLSVKANWIPTAAGTAAVHMIIVVGASKSNPKELPTAEQVLFAALRMPHNETAVTKLGKELAVSPSAAERAIAKRPQAPISLASENRMEAFVKIANRIVF